jgi:hypothetical protein
VGRESWRPRGLIWGDLRSVWGRFAHKNRQKSQKFEANFEDDLLMLKELTALCTENGAPNFLFKFFIYF